MMYLKVGHWLEAVGLILILLDLGDDLGHLPPLAEVDQLRVREEVWVALFEKNDVGLERKMSDRLEKSFFVALSTSNSSTRSR